MPGTAVHRRERRRRGAEAAREAILEAASAVFAQKGYWGATIDDVARRCGYSPAAVYKYFATKDDLFRHLWSSMARRLTCIFEESSLVSMPFELRLRWLVSRLAQLLVSSPDTLIAFIGQRPYVARRLQNRLERQAFRHYRDHLARLAGLMEQGIAEGVLRRADPEDLARLFIGLLYELGYKWLTAERPPKDIKRLVDQPVELFLRGAGAPGGRP